jgi:hypothetical protein
MDCRQIVDVGGLALILELAQAVLQRLQEGDRLVAPVAELTIGLDLRPGAVMRGF